MKDLLNFLQKNIKEIYDYSNFSWQAEYLKELIKNFKQQMVHFTVHRPN